MDNNEISDLLDEADDYCSSETCREPRHGPFVLDLGAPGGSVILCYWCFMQERFALAPEDVGGL